MIMKLAQQRQLKFLAQLKLQRAKFECWDEIDQKAEIREQARKFMHQFRCSAKHWSKVELAKWFQPDRYNPQLTKHKWFPATQQHGPLYGPDEEAFSY